MIFWTDAQLPPPLAPWLTDTFAVGAESARFLGLADAEDEHIFSLARETGDVVIASKDSDLVEMVLRSGPPPKILWVTCGNLTNRRLHKVLAQTFPDAMRLLDDVGLDVGALALAVDDGGVFLLEGVAGSDNGTRHVARPAARLQLLGGEILMQQLDGDRPFADGRRDALDRAVSDVACGEHARHARLEQEGRTI